MPSDPKRPPASDRLIWEKPDPEAPAAAPRPAKARVRRRAGSRKMLIWGSVTVVVLAGGGVAVYEVGHSKPSSSHTTASVHTAVSAVAGAVKTPFRTYSSAIDATASYQQNGSKFVIKGAGADLWTDADAYSTIYQPSAAYPGMSIETEVTAQSGMAKDAKAGIIVRNFMTGSSISPEGVILFESPSGVRLEWDGDGGTSIDKVSHVLAATVPLYLKLVVGSQGSYTGYYSTGGGKWIEVGSAKVPGQDVTQDAGMFVTSLDKGHDGTVDFFGFSVTATAK